MSIFSIKKWPSKSQWRYFLKVLAKKEKIAFFSLLVLFLGSFFFLILSFYFKNTEIQPAQGGTFVEGIVGQPRFINPIYSQASDIDRDLVELIFSGLMKYDSQSQIVPDLAEKYEIKEGGKVYEVYLKDKIFWQDSHPLTADDVVFTIKTIQNPDYKSPQRAAWLGVEVEKISDLKVRFSLRDSYSPFLENLTQKIIPTHIWKDVSPQNFPLAVYNLKPIGSGPYKLKKIEQGKLGKIISLDLIGNQKYYGKKPYLTQVSFKFFDSEEELIKIYQKGKIQGFSLGSFASLEKTKILDTVNLYSLSLPRYFAVFFNPEKAEIFTDQNLRQALNYGTNKSEILEKAIAGYGRVVLSPLLPEIYGLSLPAKIYQFDQEKAGEILDKAGFLKDETGMRRKIIKKEPAFSFKKDLKLGSQGKEVEELQKCLAKPPAGGSEIYPEGKISGYFGKETKQAVIKFQEKYAKEILEPSGFKEGTGLVSKNTRAKLNEICLPPSEQIFPLKFSLATVNQPVLAKVANLLKEQWQALGIELEIKTFDISQLEQDLIRPRNYESLLFGEVLGAIPDPFPFWHSLQKKDPGLNLAIYQNKKADELLEKIRQSLDKEERKKILEELQDILIEDSPAVFLYSPDYLYFVSKEIKGMETKIITDPSKRFSGITDWYIKTKRVWKK